MTFAYDQDAARVQTSAEPESTDRPAAPAPGADRFEQASGRDRTADRTSGRDSSGQDRSAGNRARPGDRFGAPGTGRGRVAADRARSERERASTGDRGYDRGSPSRGSDRRIRPAGDRAPSNGVRPVTAHGPGRAPAIPATKDDSTSALPVVVVGDSGFSRLSVNPAIVTVLAQRGITEPTAVQAATIPDALAGRDVCGKAPTGSGKTVAFGVPLATLVGKGRPGHPRGLVLVPTRELATQVAAELAPLLATRGRRLATFFGGVGFGPQIRALRNGVDVAVACPGRLEDLRESGHLSLDGVDLVIVDEADRMADMGFLPALRRILDGTASGAQTLLFSATLDGAVDGIVRQYQQDPVRHEVAATGDELDRMSHRFVAVASEQRVDACAAVLADSPASVVFVRTRHGADRLTRQLERSGIDAAAIHGSRSQPQRQRALDAFRAGTIQALVATDVAARGIHVDDVACVVHFDLPAEATDYVHRSGRTARAGATGRVVSLVTPDQHAFAHEIVRTLSLDAEMDGIGPARSTASRSPQGRASGRASGANRGGRPGANRTARGSGRPAFGGRSGAAPTGGAARGRSAAGRARGR